MLEKLFQKNAIIPFGHQYSCYWQKNQWKGFNTQHHSSAASFSIAKKNRLDAAPIQPASSLPSRLYHHYAMLLTSPPDSVSRISFHFWHCMVSPKKLHEYQIQLKNIRPAAVLLHPHAIAIPIKNFIRLVRTIKTIHQDEFPATRIGAAWRACCLYYKKGNNRCQAAHVC